MRRPDAQLPQLSVGVASGFMRLLLEMRAIVREELPRKAIFQADLDESIPYGVGCSVGSSEVDLGSSLLGDLSVQLEVRLSRSVNREFGHDPVLVSLTNVPAGTGIAKELLQGR